MEIHSGYLYSDDYIPYYKVRAVVIVDRIVADIPIFRLRMKELDGKVPETVLVFARHPGFDHYLTEGREVSVNIVSDVPSVPISEAFDDPGKELLAIGHFTKDLPAHARSLQPGYVIPEGW